MSVRAIARAVVPLVVVVTTAVAASGAVPETWTPVKDNPNVDELHPSPHGGFFGWAQSSPRNPEHFNFLVERKDGTRVRVNAAGTQGIAGDIVGHNVFYLQQVSDYRGARIQRYNLKTGKRSPLPAKVRKHGVNGEDPYGPDGNPLTASGPWLLYGSHRQPDPDDYGYTTVMLYNRVTHKLLQVDSFGDASGWVAPGQVNGRYAVWVIRDEVGESADVKRYDTKTHKLTELVSRDDGLTRISASVSTDGTVYYFEGPVCDDSSGCRYDLVRAAPDGTKTVLATVPQADAVPGPTYVKDRADGSRVVYVSARPNEKSGSYDIYTVIDDPQG